MKILIADKHAAFREQLKNVLCTLDNISEIYETSRLNELILFAQQHKKIDILFVEKDLVFTARKERITELLNLMPSVKIILTTKETKDILSFFVLGINGYICKKTPDALNINVLRLIVDGIPYLPPQILESLPARYQAQRTEPLQKKFQLTQRQIETLQYLGKGYSNREIAQKMNVSESTVKLHITSLMVRLQAENRTKAVLIAQQMGFV